MLHTRHITDLRKSGLTDSTIALCGVYSEDDPLKIQSLLNWRQPAKKLGSCLVFPYRQLTGELNGFAMVKPDNPRERGGKTCKYEHPIGVSPRPYLTPAAIDEIRQPSCVLLITEGQKKSLASSQAGVPAIGLSGPWGWQKKRDDKESQRELVDELAVINWKDRKVVLTFDTDPRRNFSVNYGLAELARVLTEHGAYVSIVDLLIGPQDKDGIPAKMGIDDFIIQNDAAVFLDVIAAQKKRHSTTRSLDDYRKDLAANRVDSVGKPNVYLDMSPPGAGKSHADMLACQKAGTSLTILPTHKNCKQVELDYQKVGLDAAAYPKLDEESCRNLDEALLATEHGLPASQAVCPTCKYLNSCEYQSQMVIAKASLHRIATHHRASLCFNGVSEGRKYICIHEDSSKLLRPEFTCESEFEVLADLAHAAYRKATDSFGVKDRARLRYFFYRMGEIANGLIGSLATETETIALDIPTPAYAPRGVEARLLHAMRESNTWPDGGTVRLVMAIASGDICELVLRVDKIPKKDHHGEFEVYKSICGFKQTVFPSDATVWICDATADPQETQVLAGREIIDSTPVGRIARKHLEIQVPTDIKQSTAGSKFVSIMRGLMAAIPAKYHRIGVICHRCHKPALAGTAKNRPNLDQIHRSRIAKIEYFRNGSSRGSNEWLRTCDLLIVVGTPRVPPTAVKDRLIQTGNVKAASRSIEWVSWGRDYWSGVTQSGRRVTVQGTGYRDRDWHAAYRAIVASELRQSIGRGRAICENGIPVVVLSNEWLDLVLTDVDFQPLTGSEAQLLGVLTELFPKGLESVRDSSRITEQFSKGLRSELTEQFSNNILGNGSVSSAQLAQTIDKSPRFVRKSLASLANRGLVRRVGDRGGWIPCPPTIVLLSASQPPSIDIDLGPY